ncbi:MULTISPECIES: hypothetical protein [unclassified Rhizobium]|uniref:hypothetical protein n=1 Tax=unclassified Rhizobium TaxID=2613769 RepID=UPI000EA8C212|nr:MULTISPECIES: hypothetical protein [unclassified Rhizobium]AYG64827.1 hypothetical protein CCGE531_01570 [Rhizobium sp. CCGE531]AYG71309.1 hypothetical protein CCGE532_01560 [Rhizobium sp. CCGE532]
MRFLLRFASLVALVVAVIAGTIDSIQSVAASAVVLTPMGDAWNDVSPSSLARVRSVIAYYVHPRFYDMAMQWLLFQPAFAVFLVLSLLLWMVAYKRQPAAGRFSA